MSAVLYQIGKDGERFIISYASEKFSGAEMNYHINEAEWYPDIWAMKRYRHFLEGRKFTLRTDSGCLTWLNRFKGMKSKLLRWALLLQEFDFEIEHVPGWLNELPDYLSRNPLPEPESSKFNADDLDRLALNPIVNPYEYVERKQRENLEIHQLKVGWLNLRLEGLRNAENELFFRSFCVDEGRPVLPL